MHSQWWMFSASASFTHSHTACVAVISSHRSQSICHLIDVKYEMCDINSDLHLSCLIWFDGKIQSVTIRNYAHSNESINSWNTQNRTIFQICLVSHTHTLKMPVSLTKSIECCPVQHSVQTSLIWHLQTTGVYQRALNHSQFKWQLTI